MAQNMFTHGSKHEEFTDEDAKLEFARIEEDLLEQMHQFELPDALSAENMMQLLDGVTPGVTQPARVINYKKEYAKFIACAACLVLVVAGFARMVKNQNDMVMMAEASAAGVFGSTASSTATVTAASPMLAAAPAASNETADEKPAEQAPAPKESGVAATGTTLESAKEEELNGAVAFSDEAADGNMLVVINGVLYKSNGIVSEPEEDDEASGEITASVADSETPSADGESNFGAGYKYRADDKDEISVLIDGAWYHFVKAE